MDVDSQAAEDAVPPGSAAKQPLGYRSEARYTESTSMRVMSPRLASKLIFKNSCLPTIAARTAMEYVATPPPRLLPVGATQPLAAPETSLATTAAASGLHPSVAHLVTTRAGRAQSARRAGGMRATGAQGAKSARATTNVYLNHGIYSTLPYARR